MAKLVALYRTPADASAFDSYYFSTHAPLAKKIPGLRGINNGGQSVLYRVCRLTLWVVKRRLSTLSLRE